MAFQTALLNVAAESEGALVCDEVDIAESSFHERSQTSSASVIHRLPSGRFRNGGCISQPVKAKTEEAVMSTTTASPRTQHGSSGRGNVVVL